VPALVREWTGGRGADVAFECVGATATVQSAIESTRKGGMVTLVGNISPRVELPLQSVVTRQIRLQGSCASAGDPACIELACRRVGSGRTDAERVCAHRRGRAMRLSAFTVTEAGLMKVVLHP
jgi:threonine dehydrogenase-like Zn-dependent dehydrogenase